MKRSVILKLIVIVVLILLAIFINNLLVLELSKFATTQATDSDLFYQTRKTIDFISLITNSIIGIIIVMLMAKIVINYSEKES